VVLRLLPRQVRILCWGGCHTEWGDGGGEEWVCWTETGSLGGGSHGFP
jgi:hypothetical protein